MVERCLNIPFVPVGLGPQRERLSGEYKLQIWKLLRSRVRNGLNLVEIESKHLFFFFFLIWLSSETGKMKKIHLVISLCCSNQNSGFFFYPFLFKEGQVLNEQWCAEVEKLEAFNLENRSMKRFGILKQNISFQKRLEKKKSALIAAVFSWIVVLFVFSFLLKLIAKLCLNLPIVQMPQDSVAHQVCGPLKISDSKSRGCEELMGDPWLLAPEVRFSAACAGNSSASRDSPVGDAPPAAVFAPGHK